MSWHDDFYKVYIPYPVASAGRMESNAEAIESRVEFVRTQPAAQKDIEEASDRQSFMGEIKKGLDRCEVDRIGISAGLDNHSDDWGGLLMIQGYLKIEKLVEVAASRSGGVCFGILECGYNHQVLCQKEMTLIKVLSDV